MAFVSTSIKEFISKELSSSVASNLLPVNTFTSGDCNCSCTILLLTAFSIILDEIL